LSLDKTKTTKKKEEKLKPKKIEIPTIPNVFILKKKKLLFLNVFLVFKN